MTGSTLLSLVQEATGRGSSRYLTAMLEVGVLRRATSQCSSTCWSAFAEALNFERFDQRSAFLLCSRCDHCRVLRWRQTPPPYRHVRPMYKPCNSVLSSCQPLRSCYDSRYTLTCFDLQCTSVPFDSVKQLVKDPYTSQVCSRCCLRFAGVRDALYAAAAPPSEELLAAVIQLLQQSSQNVAGKMRLDMQAVLLHELNLSAAMHSCGFLLRKQQWPKIDHAILAADAAKHANPASNTAPAHVPAHAQPSDSTVIPKSHTSQATAASTSLEPANPSPADAANQAQLAQPAQHTDTASEASATIDAQATTPAVVAAAVMDDAAAAQVAAQPQGSVSNGIDQQQQEYGAPNHNSNSGIQIPCPACLGVLQGSEKILEPIPAAMLAGLPEAEGNAGEWKECSHGSPDAVAACIRQISCTQS